MGHPQNCARDVAVEADVALQTMESKHIYKGHLPERYDIKNGRPSLQPKPRHGQLMKLGRWAPGMGHSNRPHLALHWDGAPNGPTGYGGGGVWPPLDFTWGGEIKWLRRFCSRDYYNIAGTSATVREWHSTFTPKEDDLIQGVNQGFPTAITFAIDLAIAEMLEASGALPDMPMGANAPDTYVTGSLWADEADTSVSPVGGMRTVPRWSHSTMAQQETAPEVVVPSRVATAKLDAPAQKKSDEYTWLSDDECLARMRQGDIDWSIPLHPGKHTRDREDLEHKVSEEEQAQAHFIGLLLSEFDLENSSKVSYAGALKKFMVLLNRGYPLGRFSEAHKDLAVTGLFEPSVWKPSEVEKVLIDTILHEVAVRGNAWSTVKGEMYAIRHHNVARGMPDPLANKLRYKQVMRALKKFRGPKQGKSPATRAMLMALCQDLDWEVNLDDLTEYAAVLVAFHFMLRSAEYCARLKAGKFDLDRVLRLMDIVFLLKGVVIKKNLMCADEVMITKGKQKASDGGEQRRHSASLLNKDLCVVRILALLVTKKGKSPQHLPLFTWGKGSKRPGDGVRYHDMRRLARRGAELCGRNTNEYATHSWRRGGASAYILAGCTLQQVQLYGGWALLSSLKLYVEPVIGQMMKGAQERVIAGIEEVKIIDLPVPRPRDFNIHRAKQTVMKLAKTADGE